MAESAPPHRRLAGARVALAVCLVVVFAFQGAVGSAPVSAAQTATTTANLNLRAGPSTTNTILLVMPSGSEVEITGAEQSGFFPVTYQGSSGWASSLYLRLSAPAVDEGTTARVTTRLNLRAGPGTTYAVLLVMPQDAMVTLTGEVENGFYKLTYEGNSGWGFSDYLDLQVGPPDPPAEEPATGEATVLEALNLRSGAGLNFPVIMVMPQGAVIETLAGTEAGFQKVRYNGVVGWAYATYLDIHDGAPATPNTATVTVNLNLRSAASLTAAVILVMPAGATVQLTGGYSAGFAEVVYNGQTGWAYASYLSGTGVPAPSQPTNLPILLYHRIASTPGEYQVTAAQLEQHLSWLAANGYSSVTSADLYAWITNGTPLPAKPVMITIDDGNASDWQFLQLLQKYGFEGVFYLPNYAGLTADQIRTIHQAGEVCGHTVTHPSLDQYSYSGQWAEIYNNKTWLEGIIGQPIRCFAYPFGAYNTTTTQVVIDAGYLIAYDAWWGQAPLNASLNRWHIPRMNVSGFYTMADFIALVS